jgi:hypothetical protein
LNLLESFVTVAGIISGKRLPATQEIGNDANILLLTNHKMDITY